MINECVYQSKPFGLLLIERAIIDRIVFSEQGTVALSWVDVSDFKQCHVSPDEAESLSDGDSFNFWSARMRSSSGQS